MQISVRLLDTLSFLVCRSCEINRVGSDNSCLRTHQRLAAQRGKHRWRVELFLCLTQVKLLLHSVRNPGKVR